MAVSGPAGAASGGETPSDPMPDGGNRRASRSVRGGMNRWRIVRAALVGLLVVPAAACADTDGGSDAGQAGDPLDAGAAVVLRVRQVEGVLPPADLLARLPIVTVYADGRVLTEGPRTLVFPGPALPTVELRRIAPEDVDALVERARAAGIGSGVDLGRPAVADVPVTRFILGGATGVDVLEVYGLHESGESVAGLTEAQRAGRAMLRALLAELTDPTGTPSGGDAATELYHPEAVAALASPWPGGPREGPAPPEVSWPGPALPGPGLRSNPGQGCVVVRDAALTELLTLAAKANAQTPWRSGDGRWSVALRPLLPDETECADLATD